MNSTEFAFGRNEVEHCECPAVAAGFDPSYNGLAEEAAGTFDWYMDNERPGEVYGRCSEATAKKAWLQMLDEAFENGSDYWRIALEIAVELGWCEEADYL